jgi:uncharacterized protein (TIGR00299 family) protein
MRVAILEPFSGIAGDMMLGALVAAGLDADWLKALPARVGLDDVQVEITQVLRAGIGCTKVDFTIPPQPHGRHLSGILKMLNATEAPASVKRAAGAVFEAIANVEAGIHGTSVEKVHLHEVGAVDAILDILGSVWGLEQLGVERVYCGPIAVGDGTVTAAHGVLPVPAPATLALLQGLPVLSGPPDSGELTTPTGAALAKILSAGPPPTAYTPVANGFGAGTKQFANRANALRVTIAEMQDSVEAAGEDIEPLVELVADVDDMTAEYLAAAADRLREAGARDVVLLPVQMKRGRPGTRFEVLVEPALADALESLMFRETSTIGVRRRRVSRRALARERITVDVLGYSIHVKVVRLPDGGRRAKPEFVDVERTALAAGRSSQDIFRLAVNAACSA